MDYSGFFDSFMLEPYLRRIITNRYTNNIVKDQIVIHTPFLDWANKIGSTSQVFFLFPLSKSNFVSPFLFPLYLCVMVDVKPVLEGCLTLSGWLFWQLMVVISPAGECPIHRG
jgi:hypothetical protein